MKNSRRRREVLVLTTLLGTSIEMLKQQECPTVVQGCFAMLAELDKTIKPLLSERELQKELMAARATVTRITPAGYNTWANFEKFYFTVVLCRLLVSKGWKLPTDNVAKSFIAALYACSKPFQGQPLTPKVTNGIPLAAMHLRAQGMYI